MARWGRRRFRPSYSPSLFRTALEAAPQQGKETVVVNSWGEWLEHVAQAPKTSRHQSDDTNAGFRGTNTWEEGIELATMGWHDGEAEARKISNAIMQRVGSIVERDEELFDVEGQGIDISALNMGLPEHWVRYEQHFAESLRVRMRQPGFRNTDSLRLAALLHVDGDVCQCRKARA